MTKDPTELDHLLADIRWWVGIDWASQAHRACLLDARGRILGQESFAHSGDGLAALRLWILEKTDATPAQIAVAIEVPHGPVVETLLEHGFAVFAINPKQLDRFRDRFTPAGAKDDARDAQALGDSLRTDAHCFRHLRRDEPLVIELREASRLAWELRQERVRLANRLRDQLLRYYPQALGLTDDLGAEWFLALWSMAPTPAKARRLRASSVARLLKTHRIRRHDAQSALALLRQTPLPVAPGVTEAAGAHIRSLIPRLRLVNQQIGETDRQLEALCTRLDQEPLPGQTGEQRDVAILRSSPGIGRIVIAALLGEAYQAWQRRDYHALRLMSGAAPVTKQSGKHKLVVMRHACVPRLRWAVYHWARVAIQQDPHSPSRYHQLRSRGHSHGRALRTIADRLLKVACAMLITQTPYDPNRHATHPAA